MAANNNEEIEEHITKKFEIVQKLGKGAYGNDILKLIYYLSIK